MRCRPSRFAAVILAFAPLFLQRSWRHAETLLIGAILAPGNRTVTSLLRMVGLVRERRFVNSHRVLNRAAWNPLAASRVLLGLLLDAFVPTGPVLLGIDDTTERRRGKCISAKGIDRDPVRSSHGHFVKASLCTDPARDPLQLVRWFVQRWQLEVTFREVRDHRGVETQRQWSDQAIARTTPCLLGLFSIIALLAARLTLQARLAVATSAWYRKARPTFSDSHAAVRRHLWAEQGLLTSRRSPPVSKLRPALRNAITYALCHAA